MGFLFDEAARAEMKKRDDAVEAMMDLMASLGGRQEKEIKLIRTVGNLTHIIRDRVVNHDFTDRLSENQLDEATTYLEMMLIGFNTFMEQFESTVEKENPHTSGN